MGGVRDYREGFIGYFKLNGHESLSKRQSPLRPARGEPSSRARACRPGRVGENRPRGGRELLSRTGKQTDWEEPPIESKTQLNTQIGGIENSSAMIIF